MKSAIIDWITPRGESLVPAIARNVKCERGYNHDRTGGLLCPADLDWSKDEYVSLAGLILSDCGLSSLLE